MVQPALARPPALAEARWTALAAAHEARIDRWSAQHRDRRRRNGTHPVLDFLSTYSSEAPGRLRRWHPGADVALAASSGGPAPHASWRRYATEPGGAVRLDTDAFLSDRGHTVRFVRRLLAATAGRAPSTGRSRLHKWAVIYRDEGTRHPIPLRLGQAGTDAVVGRHSIRCSHFDAHRLVTPSAAGRNRLRPTRETQPDLEQPGCLHAGMDLHMGSACI